MDKTYLSLDLDFIRELNNLKETKAPESSISNFISENRVMPPSSPLPGPVDLNLTPYAFEWLENASPFSPIQHQVWMKSAQVAATFTVENIIGYFMRVYPSAILYMSGTQNLLEKFCTKRLEPLIDSCGIRPLIVANAEDAFNRKSRRTGDKVFQKLFMGGFFEAASNQSAASMRSDSIRLLIRDETDSSPRDTGIEGDFIEISEARVKFFGDRKKIIDLSTPTTKEVSYIAEAYEEGDQRKYKMPCPHCGQKIDFFPIPEEGDFGLRGIIESGKLIKAFYVCDFCKGEIYEHQKQEMMLNGEWVPTSISKSEYYRSYYINSLYSPAGSFNWKDYYASWLSTKSDSTKERGFINLNAGLPYQEKGSRPKFSTIQHLRGDYEEMTLPKGVLYLTAAIDVQRGSEKFKDMSEGELQEYIKENKGKKEQYPRLELLITGHGAGYKTWAITYKVFIGKLDEVEVGAWDKLKQFYMELTEGSNLIQNGVKLCSIRRNDGYELDLPISFIDARDGTMKPTVISFCQMMGTGFYPSMGAKDLKKVLIEGDKESGADIRKYKRLLLDQHQHSYIISSNYYKKVIYQRSKIERVPVGEQRAGFMDHPKTFDDNYFKMLFSEEQLEDGTFTAGGRRNEALDLMVYNLCAGDVYIGELIEAERAALSNTGLSRLDLKQKVDAKYVLEILKSREKNTEKP